MTDYRRLQNARIKISLPSSSVRTARNALACRPLLRRCTTTYSESQARTTGVEESQDF